MEMYTEKIREISKRLLKEGAVEVLIGYKKGSVESTNEPCLIKSENHTDKLVWDENCRINLANYLPNRKEVKIGIVAKGCDSRNIVNLIVENKIKREQLYIIGVPCKGMASKNNPDELQHNCQNCEHRNPVLFDELCTDEVAEIKVENPYSDIIEVEAMSPDEKYNFFEDLLEPCTRCYACRNACPLCYCPTCFVDESKPQWIGKGDDPVDTRTYHLLRAFHCAGRCTDCGACEAACPQNIRVRYFTRKLEKECLDKYGWVAGLSLEKRAPLDSFELNDPEDFIK